MNSNDELKFLLTLLGCPSYRSPLAASHFAKFKGKAALCLGLAERRLVDYTREIASVKLLPAGQALLQLDPQQLPIDRDQLKLLAAVAKASGAGRGVKATQLRVTPASQRQPLLEALQGRGLIEAQVQPATKKAEVWLTPQGLDYLREDYVPKGNLPVLSLDLLRNYLQFMRRSTQLASGLDSTAALSQRPEEAAPPTVQPAGEVNDGEILTTIQALDQALGTENYLPLFQLRQRLSLSREVLDDALYRLQRGDRIELGALQEVTAYSSEEIDAGIPQTIGGPLFFVSVLEA
jgi:hypothetical protein